MTMSNIGQDIVLALVFVMILLGKQTFARDEYEANLIFQFFTLVLFLLLLTDAFINLEVNFVSMLEQLIQ